jgi:hypothetical protein
MEVYTAMINDYKGFPYKETPLSRMTPIPVPKLDKATGSRKDEL